MPSAMNLARSLLRLFGRDLPRAFPGSANYWENRYKQGGNSGNGSYGQLAAFKAEVLNTFISEHQIGSVIEFGCGDGNQLRLLKCPRYTGLDVSPTAIEACRRTYASDSSKRFLVAGSTSEYPRATMAISLDVIYHLTEDDTFSRYLQMLFDSADQYVVIYSSNGSPTKGNIPIWPPHIVHRRFTDWVERNAPGWQLFAKIPNRYPYSRDRKGNETGSFADFYIYSKAQ